MIRIFLLISVLFISVASYSQQREDTYKLLWKIEGNGIEKASYLFGTVHVNDERAFDFSDSVLVALQASDVLALEVSSDDYLKQSIANTSRKRDIPNQFKEELGKENYNTLREKMLDEVKIDLDELDNASPMLIERLLNRKHTNPEDKNKLDLDNYLFYSAKRLGKEIVGLEKTNEGIRAGKGFSTEMERAYFVKRYIKQRDSLSSFDMNKFLKEYINKGFDKMIEIYHEGDIQAILSQFEDNEMEKYDMIRRNEIMALRLDSLMQHSSVFCAIGAGHLAGKKGMIDLLKELGYQLTPVNASFTGMAKKIQKKWEAAPGYRYEDIASGFSVQMSGKPLDINVPNTNIKGIVYQDIKNNSVEMLMTVDYPQIFADKEAVIEEMVDNFRLQQKFEIISNHKVMLDGLPGRELIMSMQGIQNGKMRYFLKNGKAYVFFYWSLNSKIELPEKIPFFDHIEIYDIADFESLSWHQTNQQQYDINLLLPLTTNEFKQEIPVDFSGEDLMIAHTITFIDKAYPFSGIFQRFNYPPNYEISTNEEVKSTLVDMTKEERNAKIVLDSSFQKGAYTVNMVNYTMQDTVTLSEVFFTRGNYAYYWMSEYVGEPIPELKSFLYDWEMLPWEKPTFEKYTNPKFSVLMGSNSSVNGLKSYDNLIDSIVTYSSMDPGTGTTVRVYQYDVSKFAFFKNADSLIAYFHEPDASGKLILKQDTVTSIHSGYFTNIFRDSLYNYVNYNKLLWSGNSIFNVDIATPLDLDSTYALEVLESFQISDSTQFNFFESKLDTVLAMIQSNDSSIFQQVKGLFTDYPVEEREVYKLKNTLRKGIPLDSYSWNSPGADIISRITKLQKDSAIGFLDSLYVNNPHYESSILESLQELNSELAIQYYRKLLANKTTEIEYWDLEKYRDSTALLVADLPIVMDLFQKTENQQIIAPVLVNQLKNSDDLAKILKPYANTFLKSFKHTADTINLEDEYNWDYYFLGHLLDLTMASGNNPKQLTAEFKALSKAKSSGIKMVSLLGMMYSGKPVKRKLADEVLKNEEEADFLLKRIERTNDQSFISKYLDMETIARIYLKSHLASEDYYDVEVTYLKQFEQQIDNTTYSFYVFTYYDTYNEEETLSFIVFDKQGKDISLQSIYTDIYMNAYNPEDFKTHKEEIISDFKTYYISNSQ
ncbi:hypothetical protein GCM10011506_01440 [Marivirga lumbricoides]|uniref:TraB/GumN family protein n=1 Tax=Marivirga lumbricoides TaxID=1046115 RepID=A0ABQ1L9K1_9BACT|nr:hypothetical protein GCM10011506_01440 [Marivirga lumbricoides]